MSLENTNNKENATKEASISDWSELCSKQGWNNQSKIIHLESFIQNSGLLNQLMVYAKTVAKEESGVDYILICADNNIDLSQSQDEETLDMWNWRDKQGNCSEISFDTEVEAAENAVAWLESYSNNIS